LMENISENLLNEVEDYLKLSLNNIFDLRLILNSYLKSKNVPGFENLCFTGKYINGLFKVLKDSPSLPEVKNVDHVKKDIADNIEKITGQLRQVSLGLNEVEKKI